MNIGRRDSRIYLLYSFYFMRAGIFRLYYSLFSLIYFCYCYYINCLLLPFSDLSFSTLRDELFPLPFSVG